MKKKLFDIVTLSDCNNSNGTYTNPVLSRYKTPNLGTHQLGTIWDEGVSIIEGIINIFSGGGDSGLPGDYDNRVRQCHRWAVERGVVECVDLNKVERMITEPGIWQEKCMAYFIQLQKQKQDTGSCQAVFGFPGGYGGGATLFPPGSSTPLLLVGGGLLLFMMVSKKKRR